MKQSEWEKIEGRHAYLGDMKDPYGRRIVLVVTGGVAVYAHCPRENYYVMKDDFEAILHELNFVFAGKLENGIVRFSRETEELFDADTLEEITGRLAETL